MSVQQAAKTSFPEFLLKKRGWEREQNRRWEMVRYMVFHQYSLSPFIKANAKPRRPSDLFKLPGDIDETANITVEDCAMTAEMTAALNAIMMDFRNKRKN